MSATTATIIHVDFRAKHGAPAADPLAGMPATMSLGRHVVVLRESTRELTEQLSNMRMSAANLHGLTQDMRTQAAALTASIEDISGKLRAADLGSLCRRMGTALRAATR